MMLWTALGARCEWIGCQDLDINTDVHDAVNVNAVAVALRLRLEKRLKTKIVFAVNMLHISWSENTPASDGAQLLAALAPWVMSRGGRTFSLDFHERGTLDVLSQFVRAGLTLPSVKNVECDWIDVEELELALKAAPNANTLIPGELYILTAEDAQTFIEGVPLSRRSLVTTFGVAFSAQPWERPDDAIPLVIFSS
ncbi:hypothetical protein M427DRAFT_52757 [Gonapodya prolifera JEL478]|uniref:Uncharacterized protein n=1 Tax=Gonapodya prolifera (strain JEL478) TaxID=1344416 RepID=A0A139AT99_GONPJ|nr:hypothetical protein M427DRAFT_52757 [Gonapodya prolifera JEL478]|eukprot:KXS19939.1 hypothetical protein M427DRAFT_52757 [Gonapodya prolifera JEL478]